MKKTRTKEIERNEFPFVVEWTKTGFSAYSDEYPVVTTGKTLQEVKRNLVEALKLWLDGTHVMQKDIKLQMDMRHFFKKYSILNASQLAERIGMHKTLLSQYVSGKKMPSEEQTKKIMSGIRAIAKELAEVAVVAGK